MTEEAVMIAACAIFDCETCAHRLRGRCPGCGPGNVIQAADGEAQCAIYACVTSKNLTSCEECTAMVCPFSRDLEMVCPVRSHFEKKRCYSRKLSEHFFERQHGGGEGKKAGSKISDKTITRLRWYLFALNDYIDHGITKVSSDDIARKVGVRAWLIRRDLSQFGEFGRPSIGYDAAFLRSVLGEILHLGEAKKILWVGASRLASEPSLIKRFGGHGFKIVAVVDSNCTDMKVENLQVQPLANVCELASKQGIDAAVIAVAEDEAQSAAETLMAAGIHCILNLTSAIIVAPRGILVRNLDIVAELFALSYYCGELQENRAATHQ